MSAAKKTTRADELAAWVVEKLFAKTPNNVEKHLSREDIAMIAKSAYEVGFCDGKASTKKGVKV